MKKRFDSHLRPESMVDVGLVGVEDLTLIRKALDNIMDMERSKVISLVFSCCFAGGLRRYDGRQGSSFALATCTLLHLSSIAVSPCIIIAQLENQVAQAFKDGSKLHQKNNNKLS